MEASSSPPSDSDQTASNGAAKFLPDLPSRGFLTSATIFSSNPVGIRVYTCHTNPPEGQLIKTNQTNILIRSLQLKKQKVDSSSKDVKGITAAECSRKRAPEKAPDESTSAKRSSSLIGSQQEGSDSGTSDKGLYSLTVEKLRVLLKEQGLSPKGKKDELVARLRNVNG